MNCRATRPHKQSGVALLALLILVMLAGSYAFYRSSNLGTGDAQEKNKQFLQLIKVKESLIAYAVVDSKRPGRLPCPDLLGDGISPILSRDDCDSYSGYLPWKTLDLPEGTDFTGAHLRYKISPLFGGDRLKPELNSETETSLRLDIPEPSASNDIAALIIAPRGSFDTRNNNATDYFYNGRSENPDDNDLVVAVTRRELMAAVEQRIANQTRTCLQEHATTVEKFCRKLWATEPDAICPDLNNPDIQNPLQTYPWPAPLSNNIYKGVAGSLFGMIPETQPGNPEDVLKQSIAKIGELKKSLESASTAESKVLILKKLQEEAAYIRGFFDRLYIAAEDLYRKAVAAEKAFISLDEKIVTATDNDDNFLGMAADLPGAIKKERESSLAQFREALANLGLDVFLMEMQDETLKLQTKINTATTTPTGTTLGTLQTQSNVFKSKIFAYSSTPNPELSNLLTAGFIAATLAYDNTKSAKTELDNIDSVTRAISSTNTLRDVNNLLIAALKDGLSFQLLSEELIVLLIGMTTNPANPELLRPLLELSLSLVTQQQIEDAPAAIQTRKNTLDSIASTLIVINDASKHESIHNNFIETILRLDALATAVEKLPMNRKSIRISVDGREFSFQAEQIRQTTISAAANPDSIPKLIQPLLDFSHRSVTLLTGGSPTVIQARTSALNSIASTIIKIGDKSNTELIQASVLETTNRLDILAAALSNNGDNITLESLKAADNTLKLIGSIAPKTRPAGKTLREPVKAVIYWANTTTGHAKKIALLARKGVNSKSDNTNSAYTAAGKFLDRLVGTNGSIELLEKYIKDSSPTNQSNASAALTKTEAALNTLLSTSQKLDDALDTSFAEAAIPTLWYSDTCNHLKPPTGSDTWWKTQKWNTIFFYQLSDRTAASPGRLKINGKNDVKFQTVVLSAGKALPGQSRTLRQTASYLEDKNQHASRDGDGKSPIDEFSNNPATRDFNDRVSFGSKSSNP